MNTDEIFSLAEALHKTQRQHLKLLAQEIAKLRHQVKSLGLQLAEARQQLIDTEQREASDYNELLEARNLLQVQNTRLLIELAKRGALPEKQAPM